jgi:mRNA export factor
MCHRHKVDKPKATSGPRKSAMAQTEKINEVYAVNTFSWHPTMSQILATGGSDGLIVFWDGKKHTRMYSLARRDGAITAAAFNAKGSILAYSVGYDWSKGCNGNSPDYPLRLMLHPVLEKNLK